MKATLLLFFSLFLSITSSFSQNQVEINGFVLAALSPNVITITEPDNYEGILELDIWEKEQWDGHLNDKSNHYFPRYTKVANGPINAERTYTLKVTPGNYVLSIKLTNKTTGAFVLHHKILNTMDNTLEDEQDDGFSIKFTPKKN